MQQQPLLRAGRSATKAVVQSTFPASGDWTESAALRKLSETMNGGPSITAQRKLAEAMDVSHLVTAQRKLKSRMNDAVVGGPNAAQRVSIRDAYHKDLNDLSRPELNAAIDNIEIDERERIAAEGRLREVDSGAIAEIGGLAMAGDYAGALTAAARLAGIGAVDVRPTNDYAAVIPRGAEIPRGIPHGVTVPGADGAVVYIHEYWIRKWAEDGTIGNLLSTITHEARHADQFRVGRPAAARGDAKEFEAYVREIETAYANARRFEDALLPDANHIDTAYAAALRHYESMDEGEQAEYAAQKAEIERIMPRLKTYLEGNDETSGRTAARIGRIQVLAGQALAADSSAAYSPLYDEANRLLQTLPESQQARLDDLFERLSKHQRDLWRAFK